jgi:hypothetical protein
MPKSFGTFADVISAVDKAVSIAELNELAVAVDEAFLNQSLIVSDDEWPKFNNAIKAKVDAIDQAGHLKP